MAERRATNKYYPPDWDPSKGSVNKHKRSHPLRDRARKIDQGILVIRFEMPFNIWCLGCENHIAMGVRYNAEKKKVGNYYSTPIYEFKMKCHLCETHFVIQSDPSKFDYAIISGARRQARQMLDDTPDDLTEPALQQDDTDRFEIRASDAMHKLERKIEDKLKCESQLPTLKDLKRLRSRWEDSFAANQLIRSQFRKRRKQLEATKERDKALLQRASLAIDLAGETPSDRKKAADMMRLSKSDRTLRLELREKSRILNAKEFIPRVSKPRVKITNTPKLSEQRARTPRVESVRIKTEPK